MKTLVFFATYNEAGNVSSMIERIAEAAPHADILVVDDSSQDGTQDILAALARPNLKVIVRPGKLGLGTAHLLAWKYALHHGYEVLVTMDGDHSHDPADIPRLVAGLGQGADLVIGSRYAEGGRCDYTGYRLQVSRAANRAARLLLGIPLSEFTTSFRAFRVGRLEAIDLDTLLVGGYSFFLAVVVQARRHGLRVAERPIHFHERNAGVSKIPSLEIFRGMANLLRLAFVYHFVRASPTIDNPRQDCQRCGGESSLMRAPRPRSDAQEDARICLNCGDVGQLGADR